MTADKPSQADEAHIITAEYARRQRAAVDRMAELKALRLEQEARLKAPKPKRQRRTGAHRKTSGFKRWS
jgi:hypothetical protein